MPRIRTIQPNFAQSPSMSRVSHEARLLFVLLWTLVDDAGRGAVLVSAGTPDGASARVTVATVWRPPVITLFVPGGVPLESTATSRTALR